MVALVLVLLLVGVGVAASLGRTVDTRDSDYGLGPVTTRRRRRPAGTLPPETAGPRSSADRAVAF
jgi:hypothetical protein